MRGAEPASPSSNSCGVPEARITDEELYLQGPYDARISMLDQASLLGSEVEVTHYIIEVSR